MSQVKFGDGFIPKFDPFQDENTFKHIAQQKVIQMTDLAAKVDKLGLLGQAGVEAISFALVIREEYDADYAMDFLQLWHEGCWPEIAEDYPQFDLNSEAHKVLIAESSGMPEN